MDEDRMSNDEPLLMDRMFDEDPTMERLRHEGLHEGDCVCVRVQCACKSVERTHRYGELTLYLYRT